VHQAIAPVLGFIDEGLPPGSGLAAPPDDLVVRGLMAWTYLFGAISFELFGHRHNVVADTGAFFADEVDRMGLFVGLG
jgi:hypothetical protein